MSSTASLLDLEVVPARERVDVVATGEIDISSAPALRTALTELRESGWTDVRLDLRGITFMDSSGVHALLDEWRHAESGASSLTILPGPQVRYILELTGTHHLLTAGAGATGNGGGASSRTGGPPSS